MGTRRPTRTALAMLVPLALAAGACGGDDHQAQDFCNELVQATNELGRAGQATPQQADDIVATLNDLDPPGEIEDAYERISSVYRRIAEDDAALTDPDLATDFANVEADLREIQAFTSSECSPEDR